MRRVVLGVAAALMVWVAVGQAKAAELRVEYGELATLLRTLMADAVLHVNNEPPEFLFSTIEPSYVSIRGLKTPVPVPVEQFQRLGVTYSYYVRDVNSTAIRVTTADRALRVSLFFESEGVELAPSEGFLPSVQWSSPVIKVDFRPARVGSSIALEVTRVRVEGPMTPDCRQPSLIQRQTCRALSYLARKCIGNARKKIEEGVMNALNGATVQTRIAVFLQGYLTLGAIGEVKVRDIRADAKGIVFSFCLESCGDS